MDSVGNTLDDCPLEANADQADADWDREGDACESTEDASTDDHGAVDGECQAEAVCDEQKLSLDDDDSSCGVPGLEVVWLLLALGVVALRRRIQWGEVGVLGCCRGLMSARNRLSWWMTGVESSES